MKKILCIATLLLSAAACAQVPVCSLATSSLSVAPGAAYILNATCSPAATSFNWTGPGIPATTSVGSVLGTAPTQAGAFAFTVSGRNASGAGTPATLTLTVMSTTPAPVIVTPPSVPSPGTAAAGTPLASVCASSYVRPSALTINPITLDGAPVTVTFLAAEYFAWSFVAPASMVVARVEMTSDSYINGKDFSVSPCPGDFAATLPDECISRLMGSSMLMLDVGSTQQRCHLTASATYYLNVRMSSPSGSIVRVRARAY